MTFPPHRLLSRFVAPSLLASSLLLTGSLSAAQLGAQTTPAAPSPSSAPAPTPPAVQPPAAGQASPPSGQSAWAIAHDRQLLVDFPDFARYHEDNAKLGPPAAGEDRVVFYGDSITDAWHLAEYFPGKPYINRGISGQTTPQMLVRFRADVINLHPKVVVILAGTNDIAGNTGPTTPEAIEDNFTSMCELARANHIRVVLASILPAYDYPWKPGMQPVEKIAALNAWLKNYAAANSDMYLDYYSALQDERHGLPAKLSHDGVHPNPAGYAIMQPLAEQAIEQALKQQ